MKQKLFPALCLALALAIHSEPNTAGDRLVLKETAASEALSPHATTSAPHPSQSPLASPQLVWQQLNFQTLPSPRLGAALTLNPVNQVALLFGGFAPLDGRLNDLWLTDGRAWLQFNTPHTPEARGGASLVYDEMRQQAVLFGGVSSNGALLGDTWNFDGVDWTQQQPLASPSPRAYASMAYDAEHDMTILFGGLADIGGKYWEALNETWIWDGANWQQLSSVALPSARWGANMAYDRANKSIVLFGGGTGGFQEDPWLWDGAAWIEQRPLHHPPGRVDFGMAYDESRQQVILFGGQTPLQADPSETWAWDGEDWTKLRTFQAPPADLADGTQLVYLPGLQAVSLFSDFRQKIITSDDTFTFTERTEVWALNSCYLVFSPFFTRK
jgi:hypothetical protein